MPVNRPVTVSPCFYLCDNPLRSPRPPVRSGNSHVPRTRHHRALPAPNLHPVSGHRRLISAAVVPGAPPAYSLSDVGTADRDLPLDLPADVRRNLARAARRRHALSGWIATG